MKRFLRNIAFCLVLLLGLAWLLDVVMTHVFREGHAKKSQWQHHMRGQHYDVAIIGSSRAWWNIDMNAIDRACGIRSVNLSNNHYRDAEILLSLRIFLANGNTTERVLVQVDHDNLTGDPDEFSSTMYEFLPYLEDSVVQAHLAGRSPEWTVMRYLPLWRYVKCNFMWGPEEFVATASGHRRPLFDSTGTYFSPNPTFHGSDTLYMKQTGHRLSADMQAITAICRERNIKLDFFTTPYHNLVGTPEILDAPRRVVEAAGRTFHDFSQRIQGRENFNDVRHINRAGGKLFTALLIEEVLCERER